MGRLLNLFRRSAVERAIDEEVNFHLDYRTERNVRDGMSRGEAERAAREAFGDVRRVKAEMRAARFSVGPAPAIAFAAAIALVCAYYAFAPTSVFEIGGDVRSPTALATRKPGYTPAARAAKIEGTVRVKCVIAIDGLCHHPIVERSLDRRFGLDDQALEATRGWRFSPATRRGVPVPVRAEIDFRFALR